MESITNPSSMSKRESACLNYSNYLEQFDNPPSQEQSLLQVGPILQLGVNLGENFSWEQFIQVKLLVVVPYWTRMKKFMNGYW